MSDQGNGIWSLTIEISPGTYTYKFRNGFYDYWDGPGWEPDLPTECGFGQWNDRQFTFSNLDLVLGPYYFGLCEISESNDILGDINTDGLVNVLDVVSIVGYVLGNIEFDDTQINLADYNQDESVDVLDIVVIVNYILEQ